MTYISDIILLHFFQKERKIAKPAIFSELNIPCDKLWIYLMLTFRFFDQTTTTDLEKKKYRKKHRSRAPNI